MQNKISLSTPVWVQSLMIAGLLATQSVFAHQPLVHHHDRSVKNSPTTTTDLQSIRNMVSAFQTSGDDRYLDRAWGLLQSVINDDAPQPEALITAAFVAQARHEFSRAHAFLDKALAQQANSSQAWLLKASLHLVKAHNKQATDACRRLQSVSLLVIITCHSTVTLVDGDTQRAYTALSRLLGHDSINQTPTGILAWSFSVAGDLAVASAQPDKAIAHYQKSLHLNERSQVRAALVNVLITQGDFAQAWQSVNTAHPALPLLIQKYIVAKHTGRLSDVQEQIDKTRAVFEQWIATGDWQHAREMARFYLDIDDNIEQATRLASINARLQREPEDLKLLDRVRERAEAL